MALQRRHTLALAAALAAAFAAPAFAQAKLKVAAIYTVPVEQQWVSRIDKALKAAVARGDIEYVFSENVANADYERVMRQYAEKGNTLIVGESFAVEAAARKVAKDYPKISFLMGSSGKPQEPNFSVFDNYIQEPAYLSGLVAGGVSKSGKIGLVGGFPIPEVNRLMNAFMAGVKEVNPKAEFTISFINSWFDPPKAKEAAFAMIDKGADVMYAERFGVSDAAKERKVLAIGNVINTQAQYPDTVVASALWNMEPTIDAALAAVKAGKFKAEDYGKYSTMKFKGSELSPLGPFEAKLPKAVLDKVRAREKEIAAGSFTVKVDDAQPKGGAKSAMAAMVAPKGVRALCFDIFGTVVDWYGSIAAEVARVGLQTDGGAFALAWRAGYQPAMQDVRSGALPWTSIDGLHRRILDRILAERGLSLPEPQISDFNRIWHRLDPWPDSVPGLLRLKQHHIVTSLSNGNVALLVNMAKHGGLPWDTVLSAELFQHYKPDPEVYLGAARLLDLRPAEVMMVAAHPSDLRAAAACGLRTAYVARPLERGPGGAMEAWTAGEFDLAVDSIIALAERLDG